MIHTADLTYVVDGTRHVGFLAVDDAVQTRRPGILLGHEGGGLRENVKQRAVRLAEAGYVAFGLDYYGEPRPTTAEVPAAVERLRGDAERTRMLAQAGLDVLTEQRWTDSTQLAAIGYCFGGAMAIELARTGADLRAVAGFHCSLTTPRPDDSRNIRGRVLVCIGADDPTITRADRAAWEDEMTAAGVDWRLEIYGRTTHSFTSPNAVGAAGNAVHRYSERSDRRSWASMLDLFDEVFDRTG